MGRFVEMMSSSENKTYLARPEGQPGYVPQSYVRSAPGVFIERQDDAHLAHIMEATLRWRGLSRDDMDCLAA
jgi:hypothetical protein